jgi:glycosyltransferase involved in cell wall biosynthesis
MSNKKPDISIVIPTLNEEEYLEDALNSLRNQFIHRNYEIIISDGHSDDKTVQIAEKYDAKIVYERKRTISAGRQAGALAAQGKVIVSAGADSYADSHWLDTLTRPIFDKTHIAAIGPVVPRDGNFMEKAFSHGILTPLGHILSKTDSHFAAADNMAFDAKIFHKAGGFNPNLVTGEDTDLVRRVKPHGKIAFLPDAHVYVSMRRVREWGYWKYLSFHTSNFFKYHLKGEAHEEYEPIR